MARSVSRADQKGDMGVRLFYAPSTWLAGTLPRRGRRIGAPTVRRKAGSCAPAGRRTLGRLLDAGATVFADRGFHAARVDDIVKAARTSHGTFYLYFSSKEDLFRALAAGRGRGDGRARPGAPAADPRPRRLRRRSSAGSRRSPTSRPADGALLRTWTEAEIVDSELGQVGGDLVAQFALRAHHPLRAAVPDLDARVAALALVAMIERATYYLKTRQIRVGRAELVTTLAGVTHAGLFGATPGTGDAHVRDVARETPVLRS